MHFRFAIWLLTKVLAVILESTRSFEFVDAAFEWPKQKKELAYIPLRAIADLKEGVLLNSSSVFT